MLLITVRLWFLCLQSKNENGSVLSACFDRYRQTDLLILVILLFGLSWQGSVSSRQEEPQSVFFFHFFSGNVKKKKKTNKFNVLRRISKRSDQSWHGIRNLGQSKLSINDTYFFFQKEGERNKKNNNKKLRWNEETLSWCVVCCCVISEPRRRFLSIDCSCGSEFNWDRKKRGDLSLVRTERLSQWGGNESNLKINDERKSNRGLHISSHRGCPCSHRRFSLLAELKEEIQRSKYQNWKGYRYSYIYLLLFFWFFLVKVFF